MTLTLLARGQVNRQLAAEHLVAVGVLVRVQRRLGARVQYVGVVVFLECALDHLAELREEVLDLTLRACEWKVGDVEFRRYEAAAAASTTIVCVVIVVRRCCRIVITFIYRVGLLKKVVSFHFNFK